MCGLFGVVAYRNKDTNAVSRMVMALGKESEVRGTDAGGLSFFVKGSGMTTIRNAGAISSSGVFKFLSANRVIMGHTRMTTQGSAHHAYNNHPFPSKVGGYTLAHNGVIYNDSTLAKLHKLPDTKVETDSYIVVRMIDHLYQGIINFENLRAVAEQLEGQFNLTFQTNDGIWIVRHNNPLEVLNIESEGMIVYASTRDILHKALKSYFNTADLVDYLMARSGDRFGEPIKTNSGDIVFISNSGSVERGSFTPKPVTTPTYTSTNYHQYKYDDYDYYGYKPPHDTKSWAKTKKPATSEEALDDLNKRCAHYYRNGAVFFNGTETEVGILYENKGKKYYYSDAKGRSLEVDNNGVVVMTDLSGRKPLTNPKLDILAVDSAELYGTLNVFYASPYYTKLTKYLGTIGAGIPLFSVAVMPFITKYLFYTACLKFNQDDFMLGLATLENADHDELYRFIGAEVDHLCLFKGPQSLYMHVMGHLHMYEDEVVMNTLY